AIPQRAGRPVLDAGPRPARYNAADARLAGGEGPAAEGPARGSGAGARADRPAALEGGRRSGRRTIDQPGIGPTQRAAAPADGKPRRPRPCAHVRSTVMQAMYLMVAAVVGMQQPVVPRAVAPALADAQAALPAWDALQDEQDPTDSLWRAAQRAFNRGDYTSAARLYGDLTRRYPDGTRAGDALYW